MLDYIEVKDFLCRAIGKKDCEEADYNIIVDASRNRFGDTPLEEDKKVTITNQELLDIYNRTVSMNYDGIASYSNSCYEVAIDLDYPMMSRLRRPFDYRNNSDEVNGFLFEFMYQTDMALIGCKAIDDVFNINMSSRTRFDVSQLDKPPLRTYDNDIVDYYRLALSSNDPYIKYISFYHIMEYFYDEIFKKRLVEDLKSKITHPAFSYKNDDKIYDVALFVKNRLKMNVQDGQGNELESLKFVLSEFVSIDDLKRRVNDIDDTALSYYQTVKVPFCNASVISWNDTQGIITQIAKRIYSTRNSLVHSKSGKNDERYRPYKNEKELQKEIPLVKVVAELIVINSCGTL